MNGGVGWRVVGSTVELRWAFYIVARGSASVRGSVGYPRLMYPQTNERNFVDVYPAAACWTWYKNGKVYAARPASTWLTSGVQQLTIVIERMCGMLRTRAGLD